MPFRYEKDNRTMTMDSVAQRRLRESIKDARDIRLECLKTYADINVIQDRAVRIFFNPCVIFDEVYTSLIGISPRVRDIKQNEDRFTTLESIYEHYDSLAGPELDALLERARQTLPPRSQNDADAVHIAALEILAAGRKRTS